jgi:hypothetical protein
MNAKFVKTRKFVNENKTLLAFAAGSVTTTAVAMYFNQGKTLLELTQIHRDALKNGTAIVYELKDQTLTLVNIPAVEALQASV